MLASQATLTTSRASRYATQLGRHAAAMAGDRGHRMRMHGGANPLATGEVTLSVAHTDQKTTLTFDPWGSCTVHAAGDQLALRIDAADEPSLERIQQIVTRDLARFGRREQLTVSWRRMETAAEAAPAAPAPASRHRGRGRIMIAGAGLGVVAVVVGLHLGLGGAAVAGGASLGWSGLGWAAVGGLTLTLVVIIGHAAVPFAALRLRRRLSRHRDTE